MEEFQPKTEEDLKEIVTWALASNTALEVLGSGTKERLGPKPEAGARVHLSSLSGILSYEPEELVISAWAGTPLDEIEAALSEKSQHLAFEPPRYVPLSSGREGGTLGGLVGSGLAGPRRMSAGATRDHVLGLTGVTGRAELFKIGGRVVKNVSGYDLSKLLTGSFGTLALMTRITLKTLPAPETSMTLFVEGKPQTDALALLRAAAASPFAVSAASFGTAEVGEERLSGVFLRLEGRADELGPRMEKLKDYIGAGGRILEGGASEELWQSLRDLQAFEETPFLWRINLPRAEADHLLPLIGDETFQFDWAGARLWLGNSGEPDLGDQDFDTLMQACSGRAQLCIAGDKGEADRWIYPAPSAGSASLNERIRDAFDPTRILNPGRMGEG